MNANFKALRSSSPRPNPPFIDYDHVDEEDYNKSVVALEGGCVCLDRKLIKFGGGHSKIELCDILWNLPGKNRDRLIHVKRGKSLSTLSRLFSQGLVSSELLVGEPKFVAEVDAQLKSQAGPQLGGVIKGSDYDVIYAIVDGASGSVLDIPFFSKVTLELAAKRLQKYGFNVQLVHVTESSNVIAAKAAKKKARASPAVKKEKHQEQEQGSALNCSLYLAEFPLTKDNRGQSRLPGIPRPGVRFDFPSLRLRGLLTAESASNNGGRFTSRPSIAGPGDVLAAHL